MKRRRIWIPLVFVLVCAVVSLTYWAMFRRGTISTDDAQVTGDPVSVSSTVPGRITRLESDEGDSVEAGGKVAEVQNGDARIDVLAPSSGVIARRWVVTGDIVEPGQAIFTVYDLGNLWITANFEETKLPSLRVGEPVEIRVDAYKNRRLSGRVRTVGVATASEFSLFPAQNASGNYTKVSQRVPVRIGLDAIPVRLIPGMSVEVKIRIGSK
jgi:multidrug resistance efflux pump